MRNGSHTFESFRDPAGRVIINDGGVWRLVASDQVEQVTSFLELGLAKGWQRDGVLIETDAATDEESMGLKDYIGAGEPRSYQVFKHRRVEFPSFPYEWSPQMLYDAGELSLKLALGLAEIDWGMKDATPYNILFDGSKPTFIDLLSFEKRRTTDPIWLPYNQFVNTFLIPLLVNREARIPIRKIFLADREGMSVSEAANLFGILQKFAPSVFFMIVLPNLLSRRAEKKGNLYTARDLARADTARFVFRQSMRRLRKMLRKVAPEGTNESQWTGYTEHNQETIPEYMRAKSEFVERAVEQLKARSVLDVGCNTGTFSCIAARGGARVVAIDPDEAVIDRVYRLAKRDYPNILPLVMNLSQPTPRLGWRYSENPSFLDRSYGRFDLVMMLAVVHHMLVRDRVPLREVFRLAADLTTDALIIEYVPPTDEMFRLIARGREHLHRDLTEDSFVAAAAEFFEIVDSRQLPETERRLYLMRKR